MLSGHVVTVADHLKGFDANTTIAPSVAAKFRAAGYRFAVRYVRRGPSHNFDLSAAEARGILDADLGLMVVQHVAPEGWLPTKDDGHKYGTVAAAEAIEVGVPSGVMLWCDLEGVGAAASAQDVIDFCNEWHSAVACAGFLPGLYVGWHPGLTSEQLYNKLRFAHYWGAYNVDNVPAKRGFQMRQYVAKAADKVSGISFEFDVNMTMTDNLGGQATMLVKNV